MSRVRSPLHPVLQLQQSIGNRALQRLLDNRGATLQTKLAVGSPNDPYEQEADRVAEQVSRAPTDPGAVKALPDIQRFSEQPTDRLYEAPGSVDRALASPGRPLGQPVQRDMEQRFSHDFSAVQVHSGGDAHQSARDLNAKAYTFKHDIVFGEGQFAPESQQGRELIAHELAHVIQQRSAGVIQRALLPRR